MNDRVPPFKAHTRNPIVQSLALAVLGIALVGAVIMGALVLAVLLGLLAIGYLAALVYAPWRWARLRRRVAAVTELPPALPDALYIPGEYEVREATADAAPRGTGSSA